MLNANECVTTYPTCAVMSNENIPYEGHIIRYIDTQCNIDNLPIWKVLLGDLEKVGWVIWKYDLVIYPNSNVQNYFYFCIITHIRPKIICGIKFTELIVKYYME